MLPNFGPEQSRLSRSGLVYGASFSRASAALGSVYSTNGYIAEDIWYSMERFQLDHINEVLEKLEQGAIDDEIWGKIIIMERGKRTAKAYLRKTTIIVDGGEDEFDGKTLGFNHFSNPQRDEYTEELKSKIGDGVIIKMDNQGNIKAMARGSTPIIVQGWKEPNLNCLSGRLLREQGKLKTRGDHQSNDEERIAKIFDMRRFKSAVSRELMQPDPDARELLMKTCVRISLVKDCGSDSMKTPCWFMIINLVALDMLKTKLPQVLRNSMLTRKLVPIDDVQLPRIASQGTIIPPATAADVYSQTALSQIIAAAVQQANTQQLSESVPALHQIGQIARLAGTLALTASPAISKHEKRTHRRSRSFSDSDDSSSSHNGVRNRHRGHSTVPKGTTSSSGSSSGVSGMSARNSSKKEGLSTKSLNAVFETEVAKEKTVSKLLKEKPPKNTLSVDELTFDRNRITTNIKRGSNRDTQRLKEWLNCTSTTSDYDSNREAFESRSWSSASRRSSINSNHQPSESPQLVSESEQTDSNTTKSSSVLENNNKAAIQMTDPVAELLDAEIDKIFEYANLEESITQICENVNEHSSNGSATYSVTNSPSPNANSIIRDSENKCNKENETEGCLNAEKDSEPDIKTSKLHGKSDSECNTTPTRNSVPTVSTTARPTKRAPKLNGCDKDETVPDSKSEDFSIRPPPLSPPPPPEPAASQQVKLKTKGTTLLLYKDCEKFEQRGKNDQQSSKFSAMLRKSEETVEQKQFFPCLGNDNRERRVPEMVASVAIRKFDSKHDVQIEPPCTLRRKDSEQLRTAKTSTPEKDEEQNDVKRNMCSSVKKSHSFFSTETGIEFEPQPAYREGSRTSGSCRKSPGNFCDEGKNDCSFRSRTETGSSRTETQEARFRDKGIAFQEHDVFTRKASPSSSKLEIGVNSDSSTSDNERPSANTMGNRNVSALSDAAKVAAEIPFRRRRNGPWDHLLAKAFRNDSNSITDSSGTQVSTDDEISRCSRYKTRWKTQEIQPVHEPCASFYRPRSPTIACEEIRSNSPVAELLPARRVAARVSAMEKVDSKPVRFRNSSALRATETSRRQIQATNSQYREWRPHSAVETRNSNSSFLLPNQDQQKRGINKRQTYCPAILSVPNSDTISQHKTRQKSTKFSIDSEFKHFDYKKEQQLARPLSMWSVPPSNEDVGSSYGWHVTEPPYGRESTTEPSNYGGHPPPYRMFHNRWRSNSDLPDSYSKNGAYILRMMVNDFRPLQPSPPPTRRSSVHIKEHHENKNYLCC